METQIAEIGRLSKIVHDFILNELNEHKTATEKLPCYTLHLLLHLEGSTCTLGPLSLLTQWPIETLAGSLNRACNAKNLFSESVFSRTKLRAAALLYSEAKNLQIPHLLDQDEEHVFGATCSSNLLLHVAPKT